MKPGEDIAFEARNRPSRTVLLFLGSIAYVAIGIWILTLDPSELSSRARYKFGWAMPWVGWLCIALFGASAFRWGRAVFDKRPQIVIGPSGLFWRRWSEAEIPWPQITGIEAKSYRGNKLIVLSLNDPQAYPGRGILGLVAGINRMMGYGDIAISATGLD